MELDARKLKILAAIVEQYIATGEPVGSKYLASRPDLNFSSATIRNEMALLAEMGLIEQPHTSAGRVPSQLGYRLYIDRLMNRRKVNPEEKRAIDAVFDTSETDVDKIIETAGMFLAEITRCASISTASTPDDAQIIKIELIPTSKRCVIVVMVTSSGVVKNRQCRTDFELSDEMLNVVENFCKEHLLGKRISEISLPFIQTLAIRLGEQAFMLAPLLYAIFELTVEISEGELYLEGQSNLFSYKELSDSAHSILRLLARREELRGMLSGFDSGVHVVIGREANLMPLSESSLIVRRYQIGDVKSGVIAVLGPTRIDYAKIIANIEYFSSRLGNLLSEIADE